MKKNVKSKLVGAFFDLLPRFIFFLSFLFRSVDDVKVMRAGGV
jgi:hypothetical protein